MSRIIQIINRSPHSSFIKNMSWSFIGITSGTLLLFVANVLAGRILGPAEYGKYNLVISIATILSMLILFGSDNAAIKYGSTLEEKKAKSVFSNSLIFVLITSLIALIVLFLLRNKIAAILGTNHKLVILAAIFAVSVSIRNIYEASTRAFRRFKGQAIGKIFEGLTVIVVFSVFYLTGRLNSYGDYLLAILVGMLISVILYIKSVGIIRLRPMKELFLSTKNYQIIAFLTFSITVALTYVDRLVVGKFLGSASLGLYSAYFAITFNIMLQVSLIIINVLSPYINKSQNKFNNYKKIERYLLLSFIVLIPLFLLISTLLFKLFGENYQYNFLYMAIFVISSFSYLVSSIYLIILASKKSLLEKALRFNIYKPAILIIYYLLIYYLLGFSIYSVAFSLTVIYLYDIFIYRYLIKRTKLT